MKQLCPEVFGYETSYCLITRKGRPPNLVLESFFEALDDLMDEWRRAGPATG